MNYVKHEPYVRLIFLKSILQSLQKILPPYYLNLYDLGIFKKFFFIFTIIFCCCKLRGGLFFALNYKANKQWLLKIKFGVHVVSLHFSVSTWTYGSLLTFRQPCCRFRKWLEFSRGAEGSAWGSNHQNSGVGEARGSPGLALAWVVVTETDPHTR